MDCFVFFEVVFPINVLVMLILDRVVGFIAEAVVVVVSFDADVIVADCAVDGACWLQEQYEEGQ